ncbi:MAG: efflux RND transporter periplasmic adaptor subunit, partial [Candidatus Rokuibacteriota bacterium]
TIRDELDLVGQLEADESVVIRPERAGIIDTVEFVEGQEVKTGTLLFRLRDDEERARVAEAEAQLALAEQNYRRAQALKGENVLSVAELERATAERDVARAHLDVAAVALDRTEIRAPFDGVLGRRTVSPGDRVTPERFGGGEGTGLVQIDAVATLKLVFTVPEIAIAAVRPDMPLAVSVAPFPGETFPGQVYFTAPALDPQNRRLVLKGRVSNPDRRLMPGMFANIRVEAARHENALALPESALVHEGDGVFVWRLDQAGAAERVAVVTGIRLPGRIEVTSGLRAGDRVVTAGTHKVSPGAPLRVAETADAAASKTATP